MASRILIFSIKELSRRSGVQKYDQQSDLSSDHAAVFWMKSRRYCLPDPCDCTGDQLGHLKSHLASSFLVCYPFVTALRFYYPYVEGMLSVNSFNYCHFLILYAGKGII